METFGIDISMWQGDFNMQKAKSEGVKFVIIKAGGGDAGLYEDSQFKCNFEKAKAQGLETGAYWFGHAMTIDEAKTEAHRFIQILGNRQFEMPIFFDVEADMLKLKKRDLTNIIIAFCEECERNGWFTGIYTSHSHFESKVYDNELARFAHWVAKWCDEKPRLSKGGEVQIWQFGGTKNVIRSNIVAGVTCDCNYCYVDNYKQKMIDNHLNNFTSSTTTRLSNEEVARLVIRGEFGNGAARRAKLSQAGYNYKVVQAIVNDMLK